MVESVRALRMLSMLHAMPIRVYCLILVQVRLNLASSAMCVQRVYYSYTTFPNHLAPETLISSARSIALVDQTNILW